MWPIRSPFGLRTAVPSIRSLAISGCGFAMTSVIITLPYGFDEVDQRCISEGVPSGGQGFEIGLGIVVKGHRLEAVITCPAVPEIGYAARTVFNPLRGGDWLAALGAGILFGQIAEIYSGHGASPFASFYCWIELDRIAAG